MLNYDELEKEILWVLKNYGSPAQERKQPGSMVKNQAQRIVEFIRQYEETTCFFHDNNFDLIKIERRT